MVLNHFPKPSSIRIGGHALKNNFGRATGQGTIGNVGVASHPADVCSTPEDIAVLNVKGVLHGENGMQQIAR